MIYSKYYQDSEQVGISIVKDEYIPLGFLYLQKIQIFPPYRNRGYGTLLIQDVNKLAIELKLPICTYNFIEQKGNTTFIEKLGWKPFSRKESFYTFNAEERHKKLMEWAQNNL